MPLTLDGDSSARWPDPPGPRWVAETVAEWFSAHARVFPWRWKADPYMVLVTEILLQRTRAQTVASAHAEFFQRWPDPRLLAASGEAGLESFLANLGLRYRAGRLRSIAHSIVLHHGGHVPADAEALLRLPGVGPYIASATLAFGHLVAVPVVDRNVMSVLARHAGVTRETEARGLVAHLYRHAEHRVIAYGLIDMGATVCTPRGCACPLSARCPRFHAPPSAWRMLRKTVRAGRVRLSEQPVTPGHRRAAMEPTPKARASGVAEGR